MRQRSRVAAHSGLELAAPQRLLRPLRQGQAEADRADGQSAASGDVHGAGERRRRDAAEYLQRWAVYDHVVADTRAETRRDDAVGAGAVCWAAAGGE